MGILPLLLASLMIWLRRDKDKRPLFFMGWGAIGLLWTLGTPFYGLLYILPVFNGLLPSRTAFLLIFCVAILAAMGVDRLQSTPVSAALMRPLGAIFLFWLLLLLGYTFHYRGEWEASTLSSGLWKMGLWGSLGGVLLWGRIHGRIPARTFGGLALALITLDLFQYGLPYNPVSPISNLYPPTPTTTFLQQETAPYRVVTLSEGVVFYPNTALTAHIPNLSAYEPGLPQPIVDLIDSAEGSSTIRFERILMPLKGVYSPLIDMLNVKYILSIHDLWQENSTLLAPSEPIVAWHPLDDRSHILPLGQAGLHRLDLFLRPQGQPQGKVILRLFTTDEQQPLAHAELNTIDITSETSYPFYFGAFPSEWGREFRFTLTFEGNEGGVEWGATAVGSPAYSAYILPRPPVAHEAGKTRIYHNEGYFPRAYAVPTAHIVDDQATALTAVVENQEQLRQIVILELMGNEAPPPLPSAEEVSTPANEVTISDYDLNRVTMTVVMQKAGFVVLADSYYPGWQATIDGVTTAVYRANSILRAVYVPAGQHTINYTFRPPDFLLGALISGLTLLVALLILGYGGMVIRR